MLLRTYDDRLTTFQNYPWIFNGSSKFSIALLSSLLNSIFYWVAACVDRRPPTSSVCSLVYPPGSLANQNVLCTFFLCIFWPWFLLVECVALSGAWWVMGVALGVVKMRLVVHSLLFYWQQEKSVDLIKWYYCTTCHHFPSKATPATIRD